jgi:hypothetical protein
MWLLVGAPTISRVLPAWSPHDVSVMDAAHGDEHASMDGMGDMPGMPDMGGMPQQPDPSGDPTHHMDQCGYCVLLGHTPLLSGGVVAVLLAAPLPVSAPLMLASAAWHAQPWLSANPRGPPSVLAG